MKKYFAVFYVFSFPPAVYVGTLNLIASIPGPFILTLLFYIKMGFKDMSRTCYPDAISYYQIHPFILSSVLNLVFNRLCSAFGLKLYKSHIFS